MIRILYHTAYSGCLWVDVLPSRHPSVRLWRSGISTSKVRVPDMGRLVRLGHRRDGMTWRENAVTNSILVGKDTAHQNWRAPESPAVRIWSTHSSGRATTR